MNEKEQERWSVRQHEVFFLYLNLSSVPDESTPGKYAYICIFGEFEWTRQSLKKREFILKVTFSLPSPSSMLKLPNYLSSHLM